jgi:hypothetical protein
MLIAVFQVRSLYLVVPEYQNNNILLERILYLIELFAS